jgi:DNA-binding NarL/FixJ family response regulator
MTPPIRVVVGEDSYLVREGILRILAVEGIETVGAAADLDSLRELVERERPDVAVVDIRMPPTMTDEGIRFAVEVAASHPDVGVVVLSQHMRATYANDLFETGNPKRAYLVKERLAEPRLLFEAIRSVSEGRPFIDPELVAMIVTSGDGRDLVLGNLTERERTVLALIAEGRSNAAIAKELVLTTRAVERHVNSIFTKLELHDGQTYNRRVLAALLYMRGGV